MRIPCFSIVKRGRCFINYKDKDSIPRQPEHSHTEIPETNRERPQYVIPDVAKRRSGIQGGHADYLKSSTRSCFQSSAAITHEKDRFR